MRWIIKEVKTQHVHELFEETLGYSSPSQNNCYSYYKYGSFMFRLQSICLFVIFTKQLLFQKVMSISNCRLRLNGPKVQSLLDENHVYPL